MKRTFLTAQTLGAIMSLSTIPIATAAMPDKTNVIQTDTLRTFNMDEVVITSSSKETNSLRTLPAAVSILTPQQTSDRQITSIKDISTFVPNLYIPDYGAKLTSAVYIRGVGARSSGQSIGLYVDGAPLMDKTAFDFELTDIQRIEVLRGPQGTLYGRNAMGGIINIHTLSPLKYHGTRASLSYGNYGQLNAKVSTNLKLHSTFGLSAGVYHDRQDGFFTNTYNNKKADSEEIYGGNVKLNWQITPRLTAAFNASYENVKQGAFPYGYYDKTTGTIAHVRINDESSYRRALQTNNLSIAYQGNNILLTSVTGYQYLDDDMRMDQDFSDASMFILNQRQKQHAFSEEITLKNISTGNYRWSTGLYGFYNKLHTDGPVEFKKDGMKSIFQPMFDNLKKENPRMPEIKVDTALYIPGAFETPSLGMALYHQSTIDNLLTDGLSLTVGIRLDYEKQELRYESEAKMNLSMSMSPAAPPVDISDKYSSSVIDEHLTQEFIQALPKIALTYTFSPRTFAYVSVAKGYKAGGYNIQMAADLMQGQMRYDVMNAFKTMLPNADSLLNALMPTPVKDVISYKPETSWNYEIGFKCEPVKERLYAECTLFYMDVDNVQLTKFVAGGSGRILSNAGKARSYGAELSVRALLSDYFSADLNYGYTRATFRDYNNDRENFKGKFIPYTPQHTLSVGLHLSRPLPFRWADRLTASAQCNSTGKIYWTEANNLAQPFHAIVNAQVALHKGAVSLGLWARNLTGADYSTFYFESFDKPFMQKGKPLQCGAKINVAF